MDACENKVLVFVYGTLMKGYDNHNRLDMQKAEFCGHYQTTRLYALFADDFPYVHPELPRTVILGELYRIGTVHLEALDELEEHPEFYCRELTLVVPRSDPSATPLKAYLYFNKFVHDGLECSTPGTYIPSGNFRDYCASSP